MNGGYAALLPPSPCGRRLRSPRDFRYRHDEHWNPGCVTPAALFSTDPLDTLTDMALVAAVRAELAKAPAGTAAVGRASTASLGRRVVLEPPHNRAGTLDHTRDENFAVRGGCPARIAHDAGRG